MIHTATVGTEQNVLLITLDEPERRNALGEADWDELGRLIEDAPARAMRAIVITGAGSTFCAGADLTGLSIASMAEKVERAFAAARDVPLPVLAFVNGAAVGAGMQLILSCDLRTAAPTARFRIPAAEISLPVHPGTIARLVALAGSGTARSLLLGCSWLDFDRAYALGLVDRPGTIDDAIAWAEQIAGYAPLVLAYFKRRLQVDDSAEELSYRSTVAEISASADFAEAMAARADRRAPRYRGV